MRPMPTTQKKEMQDFYVEMQKWMLEREHIPIQQEEFNPHGLLKQFCQVKNAYPSYSPQISPLSNRAIFIINTLNDLDVKYNIDVFTEQGMELSNAGSFYDSKLLNIIIEFNPELRETTPAILFCAHHDIVNIHSDNAQDNSASVCNLIYLAYLLKKNEVKDKRVIIVFTDREEYGGVGAKRMSQEIQAEKYGQVDKIFNLELTGLGTELWTDSNNMSGNLGKKSLQHLTEHLPENKKLLHVSTPFSDAYIFRRNGLDAVCIGILPEGDLTERRTWHLCHSNNDTFEKTNKEDMKNFVDEILYKLI